MAALAEELVRDVGAAPTTAAGLEAEVFPDIEAAEPLWRRMEADPAARATPYQRLAWVRAYAADMAGTEGFAPRIVVLRDRAGCPRLLLPLAIGREAGCRVARFIGGRHANFHMPVAVEPRGLDPAEVRGALAAAGRALGLDLFAFSLQPVAWDGVANPLAAGGLPSASDAYGTSLDGDAEATARRIFSNDARKKLRNKEKRLVEIVGPIEHRRPASADEVDRTLDAFHAFKAARFAEQGLANPFADPAVGAFLRTACLAGLSEGRPAVELHALVAPSDERILAIYAGAVDARRFSAMLTAFDSDPQVSRYSPGDQLLLRLIQDQAARGRSAFDLGVGEAEYKARICDTVIPLAESVLPVTVRGRLLGGVRRAEALARRRIKRTPWAMALARRLTRE